MNDVTIKLKINIVCKLCTTHTETTKTTDFSLEAYQQNNNVNKAKLKKLKCFTNQLFSAIFDHIVCIWICVL